MYLRGGGGGVIQIWGVETRFLKQHRYSKTIGQKGAKVYIFGKLSAMAFKNTKIITIGATGETLYWRKSRICHDACVFASNPHLLK